MKKTLIAASLAVAALSSQPVMAQVAGGTTSMGVAVVETTQLAMGWSVKKTLMGKTVYNETGAKVGKVEDLIISPDKFVSYVIVGAGGFVGIGRHDVAIPVALEKRSSAAAADAKAKLDGQIAALRDDIKDAEAKLTDMKGAAASKWKSFEGGVSTAMARLRKSMS